MSSTWDAGEPGTLTLPSGRLIWGRGLRNPAPGGPDPEFGLYVAGGGGIHGVPWALRPAAPQASRARARRVHGQTARPGRHPLPSRPRRFARAARYAAPAVAPALVPGSPAASGAGAAVASW